MAIDPISMKILSHTNAIFRHLLPVLACLITFITSGSAFSATGSEVRLTDSSFKVAYCNDCVPFDFQDEAGNPSGLLIDLWKLWSDKTGQRIEFVPYTWEETLKNVGSGEADAHAGLFFNKQRDKFLEYGQALSRTSTHLFLHNSLPEIDNLTEVSAYRVGVLGGDYVEGYLKERLPAEGIIPYPSYQAIISALKSGELSAFAADTPSGVYYLRKGNILDEFSIKPTHLLYVNDWFVAVTEGNHALLETINKGFDLVSKEERLLINSRWMPSQGEDEAPDNAVDKGVMQTGVQNNTGIVWWIIGAIVIFGFFLLVVPKLSRSISKIDLAQLIGSSRYRMIVLIVMSVIVTFIAGLVLYTLDENRKAALNSIRGDLQATLSSTVERLDFWVHERKSFLLQLGRDPELVAITKRLLEIPPKADVLKNSEPLTDARAFFKKNAAEFGKIGFFIINHDDISIGSGRDSNLGTKNFIAEQEPDKLFRAFQGEAVFIPPIRSDVEIQSSGKPDGSEEKKPLTMFFAVPIRDADGSVLAVLTQRLLPAGRLSQIMRSGRIGASGESYALNQEGLLISGSRFKQKLYDTGLLKEGENEHEKLEIRDPGGNLLKGFRPTIRRSELPLTRMAQGVIRQGKEMWALEHRADERHDQKHDYDHSEVVIDVDGYRDYRGVPVMGAWMWDDDVGLGIATEIDIDEAMADYDSLRLNLLLITSITLLLTISALLLSITLGERVTRTLQRARDELETRVKERTKALKESQERQELALRGGMLGSWDVNFDTGKIVINERYAEIFGCKEDHLEINWDEWIRCIHPDDRARITRDNQGYRRGYLPDYEVEYRLVKPDEEMRWVLSKGAAVECKKDGIVRRMVGTVQDITEKKLAEERLEKLLREINFQKYAMDQHAIVSMTDPKGNITYVNDRFCETSGYTEQELLGKNHRILKSGLHPDSLYEEMWLTIVQGKVWHGEVCNKSKDGALYWVNSSIVPFLSDDGPERYISIRTDITQRKQAEEALRSAEERSRLLLESVGEGIFGIGEDGLVNFINPEAVRLLGYEAEELLSQKIHPIIHHTRPDGSEYPIDDCPMYKSFTEGAFHTIEDEILWRKDGTSFPVQYNSVPVYKEDKLSGAVVVFHDITQRIETLQAMEEARKAAEDATMAKSDFLANMSHEIRTPMNAIIGMSHLTMQTGLDRKQRDYVTKIHGAAESLLGIINDILDFSKIEAGKLEMESVSFSLDGVLDNLAHMITVRTREKGLELLIDLHPEVPTTLVGDSLRLGQVLTNLANNAVKFTEEGEIVICIDQVKSTDEQVTLQFSISDTGIGMTEEQIGNLFQSFSQADASTTRKYGGTGLGLTISKTLVEMVGGKIWVESTVGEGSTFIFTANFGLSHEIDSVLKLPKQDLRGLPVLVVDDSPAAREIMQHLAETLTFQVDVVANGEEALDGVRQADQAGTPYGMVFTDWKMPGMDGIEVVRQLKSDITLKAPPKIVMVTAYDRDEMLHQLGDLLIDGYLTKPVSISSLLDVSMMAMGYEERKPIAKARDLDVDAVKAIRGARVLLVEDNAINQQVATELLQMAGFVVTVADDGQVAVSKIKAESYDAVLMDVQMPVMDGYTATREIRKDPAFADVPIIAMTANAMAGDREKCLDAGMNDHVAKPIDPNNMFATLGKWVEPLEGVADVVVPAPAVKGVEIELPSLPGVDLESGLMRVAGNRKLYLELMQRFAAEQANAHVIIEKAMAEGDRQLAERMAHTVKGVSGNLGASALQELGAELEEAIQVDDKARVAVVIAPFGESLSQLTEAINAYVAGRKQMASDAPISPEARSEVIDVIARIRELLADDDSDVLDLFAEQRDLLAAFVAAGELSRLDKVLNDFDFVGALAVVDGVVLVDQQNER